MAKYRIVPTRDGGFNVVATAGHGGLVHKRVFINARTLADVSKAAGEAAAEVSKWRKESRNGPG